MHSSVWKHLKRRRFQNACKLECGQGTSLRSHYCSLLPENKEIFLHSHNWNLRKTFTLPDRDLFRYRWGFKPTTMCKLQQAMKKKKKLEKHLRIEINPFSQAVLCSKPQERPEPFQDTSNSG